MFAKLAVNRWSERLAGPDNERTEQLPVPVRHVHRQDGRSPGAVSGTFPGERPGTVLEDRKRERTRQGGTGQGSRKHRNDFRVLFRELRVTKGEGARNGSPGFPGGRREDQQDQMFPVPVIGQKNRDPIRRVERSVGKHAGSRPSGGRRVHPVTHPPVSR